MDLYFPTYWLKCYLLTVYYVKLINKHTLSPYFSLFLPISYFIYLILNFRLRYYFLPSNICFMNIFRSAEKLEVFYCERPHTHYLISTGATSLGLQYHVYIHLSAHPLKKCISKWIEAISILLSKYFSTNIFNYSLIILWSYFSFEVKLQWNAQS